MSILNSLLGGTIRRVSVTIPANTSTSATIASLIAAQGEPSTVLWFKILGVLADKTTARPAITLASMRQGATSFVETDYTTNGEPVAAGVEYLSGPTIACAESGIRSDSASTITVTIVFCA